MKQKRNRIAKRLLAAITMLSTDEGLIDLQTMTLRAIASKYQISLGTSYNAKVVIKKEYPELFTAE